MLRTIVAQQCETDHHTCLLCSFSTSEDTRTFLEKAHSDLLQVWGVHLGELPSFASPMYLSRLEVDKQQPQTTSNHAVMVLAPRHPPC